MDREILAAIAEYVETSTKTIESLTERLERKYSADQPRDYHGRFGEGTGVEGSGNLPFNSKGDQYFHALNKNGQAFVARQAAKYGVNIESYLKEVKGRLTGADGKPNTELLAAGSKWYPMAHELAQKISDSTQGMTHPIPLEVAATALAKLSPQTAWETNAEVGARLSQFIASGKADGMNSKDATLAFKAEWKANGWGGESITNPGTKNGLAMMNNLVQSAVESLTGAKSVEDSLQSVKQRSFANCIMLPGATRDVTVDIMMQKGLTYAASSPLPKDDDGAKELGLKPGSNGRYPTMTNLFSENSDEVSQAIRPRTTSGCLAGAGYVIAAAGACRVAADDFSKELGTHISPDQVQAAYWLTVQDQTPPGWPRSTGATMTQIKMPLVNSLLGHPFIGTAEYDVNAAYAKAATWAAKASSVFPLDVDYGTMGLDPIEEMDDEDYEKAIEEGKAVSTRTLEVKYSDDEARDDHGRWTSGGDSGAPASVRVSSIDEAIKLLGEGKGIMFERPDQAVTLLHELSRIANEAKAAGTKAPTYDLCKVSVANTNLFCADNVGIPRAAMPQLIGKPIPGSPADSFPKNAKGEVDLGQAFRDYLGAQGHLILDTDEFASHLRASQTEMDGTKVGGMMESMQAGTMPPGRIFISDDNYVIDGHHRWAATVGEGLGDKKEMSISVARINMKILPALKAANDFATSMGLPQSGISKAFFDALDLKSFGGDVELKYSEDQERDETGRWANGAAHLQASHDGGSTNHLERNATDTGWDIVHEQHPPQPQSVRIDHYTGRGDAAKARAAEIAATFPKSAGVRVSTLTGVAGPGGERWNQSVIHSVGGQVNFTPDKTTGELNEAGIRRYGQIARGFDKLGIPVQTHSEMSDQWYGRGIAKNEYASRAEFETALAQHAAKKSFEGPPTTPLPVSGEAFGGESEEHYTDTAESQAPPKKRRRKKVRTDLTSVPAVDSGSVDQLPEQRGFPDMEIKKLSDAEKADFERETDKIRENVAKPENKKPHKFEAAQWTHPNGHPRCIRCGEEESTTGMCSGDMVPTGEDAQSGSRPADGKEFETRVQFKMAEMKGDASGLIKWFEDGADGQINWGSPGDFDDCVTVASKHMDEDQAKGFCNLRHQGATGGPPGHAPGESDK